MRKRLDRSGDARVKSARVAEAKRGRRKNAKQSRCERGGDEARAPRERALNELLARQCQGEGIEGARFRCGAGKALTRRKHGADLAEGCAGAKRGRGVGEASAQHGRNASVGDV